MYQNVLKHGNIIVSFKNHQTTNFSFFFSPIAFHNYTNISFEVFLIHLFLLHNEKTAQYFLKEEYFRKPKHINHKFIEHV